MQIATQLPRPLLPSLLGAALAVGAMAATEGEHDGFFDDFEDRIAKVNEGALEFLSEPPAQPVHHHQNILTSVEARYPCNRVQLTSLSPPAQDGFRVTQAPCRVYLDAWFQGRLRTEFRFVDRAPAI